MPTHRLRGHPALPATLIAALLVAIAACGSTAPTPSSPSSPAASAGATAGPTVAPPAGSGQPASPSPESTAASPAEIDVLREAALASVDDGTVRLVYTVAFEGANTVPDGVFLTGRGQTSFEEPRRAYLSAHLLNESFGDWEMILDDRALYLKGEVVAQLVPAERWLLVDLDSSHRLVSQFAALASGQNDTSLALFYILGATDDVQVGAGEAIDGVDTTRYRMAIDLATIEDRLPAGSTVELDDNIAALEASGISPEIEAEVWVGSTGRVLRTRYVYTLGPGEGGGQLIGTYGFSDFGAEMELGTPTGDDVIRLEDAVSS